MKRSLSVGFRFQLLLVLILRTAGAFAAEVSLTESRRDAFSIEGRFTVRASSAAAWRVLTDYDGIGAFVSSIENSRVKERSADRVLVEQSSQNGVWLLRRRFEVLLEVRESAGSAIEFRDVGGRSFRAYRGSWRIEPREGGTAVKYHLEAEMDSGIPGFLSRRIVRRNIERLLDEVAGEIARREEIR